MRTRDPNQEALAAANRAAFFAPLPRRHYWGARVAALAFIALWWWLS